MTIPRVAILGMGYVGLTTGMALAKHGFKSICTTTTPEKVEKIKKGIPPFYEPELEKHVFELVKTGMLSGTTNNLEAVLQADITFICVGTPMNLDGSANLTSIKDVSKDIGKALKEKEGYHVIAAKSTIPPGTTTEIILPTIEKYSKKKVGTDFGLCMNPEFLRQGEAVHDSLQPDRIVIGEYDIKSGDTLENLYSEYTCPKIRCDIKAAELIKYAANSLLATKISFANEFSRICEKYQIDVYEVMKGVGLDYRIGPHFLNAGVGFGGSCFPKDVNAIVNVAKRKNVPTPILNAVLEINETQPLHFVELMRTMVGSFKNKKIAVLGLSFKPNTDDIRDTRALPIIESLIKEGAYIKAYDPQAINNFKELTSLPIEYYLNWKDALSNSDFAVIQSDWKEIKEISPDDYKKLLKKPIVFDGRRTYDPKYMISNGIQYYGVGWKNT